VIVWINGDSNNWYKEIGRRGFVLGTGGMLAAAIMRRLGVITRSPDRVSAHA
jgi:hypothetical protein